MQTAAAGEQDKQLSSTPCRETGFSGKKERRGTIEGLGRVREVETYKKREMGCFMRNVRQGTRCWVKVNLTQKILSAT